MKQALGLVEISGLSTAMIVADTMAKAANIQIVEVENTKGLGYMTIKIIGDVGAVKAAVDAGRQIGSMHQQLAGWKIIPRPSDSVEQLFCKRKAEILLAPEIPEEAAPLQEATIEVPAISGKEETRAKTSSKQPSGKNTGKKL